MKLVNDIKFSIKLIKKNGFPKIFLNSHHCHGIINFCLFMAEPQRCYSSFDATQLLFLFKSSLIWAPLIPIKTHLQISRLSVALITPHRHTLRTVRAVTPCLCMREDTQSGPNLSRHQCEVTACAPSSSALDGPGMYFGKGVGQQRPTSIAASEPDMNDK